MTDLPDVFLPYQQRLWAAIDANQVVVIEKSRRTGYSWALAAVAASAASSARSAGGQDALYMGYEKEMTREFIDYVAIWAKAFQVAASEVEEFVFKDPDKPDADVLAFRVQFASGFEVIALPNVARALRGKQGLVILDEVAFMKNLDEVLKAAFALLIWGGKVVVCSTHNGDMNPFNVLVQDVRAGRVPYALLRTTFDEACAEGLYRRICLRQGIAWTEEGEAAWRASILAIYRDNADEELHVIPNPSTGAYLPGPLLELRSDPAVRVLRWAPTISGYVNLPAHVRQLDVAFWCKTELLPVLDKLDASDQHAVGEDFGRVRDLTVLWVLAITPSLQRPTRLVIELRDMPFEQQRDVLFYVLERLPRLRKVVMDGGGNGAYLGEVAMQRFGGLVEPVQLSEPWYREHMPPMKAAIEDGVLSLPRDRDIIGDLRQLKLVRGVARVPHRTLTDEGASRHGDAAIACCLAYAATRGEATEYGYEAAGRAQLEAADPRRWSDRARDWEEDNPPPGRSISPALRGSAFA